MSISVLYLFYRMELKKKIEEARAVKSEAQVTPAVTPSQSLLQRKKPVFKKTSSEHHSLTVVKTDSPAVCSATLTSSNVKLSNIKSKLNRKSQSETSFEFPPCGDSFFEDSMPLPSTLASYKENQIKNSPSIRTSLALNFSKPNTPVLSRSEESNRSSSSFTPAGRLLKSVQNSSSLIQNKMSSVQQTNCDNSGSMSGTDFNFDYNISESSVIKQNFKKTASLSNANKSGNASFDLDIFDSEMDEEFGEECVSNSAVATTSGHSAHRNSAINSTLNNSASTFNTSTSDGGSRRESTNNSKYEQDMQWFCSITFIIWVLVLSVLNIFC